MKRHYNVRADTVCHFCPGSSLDLAATTLMDDRRDKCIAHATEARNKVSRCLESGARVDDRVAAMVNRLQLLSTRMAAYAREVTH